MGFFNLLYLRRILTKNVNRIKLIYSIIHGVLIYEIFKLNSPINLQKEKGILFVGNGIPVRIARISKWLKRKGYYTILITNKSDNRISVDYFTQIIIYNSKWHLNSILKNFNENFIIHYWGTPSNTVSFIPDNKQKIPCVYDCQDLYISYYGFKSPHLYMQNDFKHEKKCLEKSDGIISQSFEAQNAFREYKITEKPKTLFFPFYCDDDIMVDYNKQTKLVINEGIHLVYVGNISAKVMNNPKLRYIEFEDKIKLLSYQKIHLHIYCSPNTPELIKNVYKKIDSENSYFHLHKTIPQKELIEEISNYHFGILPFYTEDGIFTPKRFYSTSGKIINYMEAALPILISSDLPYQNWITKRYGESISLGKNDWNDLKKYIDIEKYNELCISVMDKRRKFKISDNIIKLINTYNLIKNNA